MNLRDLSPNKGQKSIRGITLIELLIVIGLITLLGAAISPFFSQFIGRNNLAVTTDTVLGMLRKAQTYAMDGRSDTVWGICMTGSTVRMYAGSCASPTVSEEHTIPATVSVNGLTDTTFSKGHGEPSNSMTIIMSNTTSSNTIQVNTAGAIEVD